MPGGIGNHAYCLAKELGRLGFGVTVLTEKREQRDGDWRRFVEANNELSIFGVPRNRVPAITYCHRVLKANMLVRKADWDAVVFSGKFPLWLNAILPRTRSIAVIHGSEIKQSGLFRHLFRHGLKKAETVVCVSEFTRGQLSKHYAGVGDQNVRTINNGIGNDWLASAPIDSRPEHDVVLVTVGAVNRRKGQLNVIRAMPRILREFPDATYHIVGLPVEKACLIGAVDAHGLRSRIAFHDGPCDSEVRSLVAASHIFMMLSEHLENGDFEGFGIAVVEAMALGKPAIGSRDSGIADAIEDGHSGRLVDPRNADEVAAAVREIMDDYARYSANARAAAERARWKHRVNEYRLLIDQLCG